MLPEMDGGALPLTVSTVVVSVRELEDLETVEAGRDSRSVEELIVGADFISTSSSTIEYVSSSSLRVPFSLKTIEAGP